MTAVDVPIPTNTPSPDSAMPDGPTLDLAAVQSFPLERPPFRRRRRDTLPSATQLAHFVAGPENRLVGFLGSYPGDLFELGNPLLLVGPSGVGKSSLALHFAACGARRLGSVDGPAPVSYLPAVDFARGYAEAVDTDDVTSFRESIENSDLLVIDDLHLISSKPAAQGELASRLEARHEACRPTVVTCRRLPPEIRGLQSRLVSRVLAGLTVPVRPPAQAARRLLLHEFALLHGVRIDSNLLDILESGLPVDLSLRPLEAAIKQVDLQSRMSDSEPSIETLQAVLSTIGQTPSVSVASITSVVARHFRVKASELKSSSRRQRIVRARSLAMWLARRLTSSSLQQIGESFGGRDHSTVLHAIRKTTTLLDSDADLRRAAEELQEKLAE